MNKKKILKNKIRLILTIILIAALSIYFTRNNWISLFVKSTDLSDVAINGIFISDNISDIDLTKYKKNPDFISKDTKKLVYKYYQDFLIVYDHSGVISELQTISKDGVVTFGGKNMKNFDDVEKFIGNHFSKQSYDSDQGLIAKVYYDKVNRIKASFVYPKYNVKSFIWAILERY